MKSSRAQLWTAITALAMLAGLSGCKPAHNATAASSPNGPYRPQLTPRFQAGEAFGYRATASLENNLQVIVLTEDDTTGNVTAGAAPSAPHVTETIPKETHEAYAVELVADGLARVVYPNGTLREVVYLVHRCEIIHPDGQTETLAPAGAVLGARRQDDGRLAFAINGAAPDPKIAQSLAFVAQLGEASETDDELLGPTDDVPVGGSWQVNEAVLLKSAFAEAYPGTQQAVGSFHLDAVKPDEAGHLGTVVSGGFSLEGMRPPFPPQVEALPSVVNYQMQIAAPLDWSAGVYDADLKTLTHHQGKAGSMQYSVTRSETHFDVNISLEQHARYTFDPAMKPAPALVSAPQVPELPPPSAQPQTGARMLNPEPVQEPSANPAAAPAAPQTPSTQPTAAAPAETPAAPTPPPSPTNSEPPPAQPQPSFWSGAQSATPTNSGP